MPLGRVLAVLGRLSDALGRLLGVLGCSWAPLGRPLGASWAPLGRLLGLLGASWAHFGRFGVDFRRFQGGGGRGLDGGRDLKMIDFFHIRNKPFAQPQMQDTEQRIFEPLPSNCNDATGPSMPVAHPILLASELPDFRPPSGLGGMREA